MKPIDLRRLLDWALLVIGMVGLMLLVFDRFWSPDWLHTFAILGCGFMAVGGAYRLAGGRRAGA